jgi:hypothetical protein
MPAADSCDRDYRTAGLEDLRTSSYHFGLLFYLFQQACYTEGQLWGCIMDGWQSGPAGERLSTNRSGLTAYIFHQLLECFYYRVHQKQSRRVSLARPCGMWLTSSAGRLRPDFMARCKWDAALQACTGFVYANRVICFSGNRQ